MTVSEFLKSTPLSVAAIAAKVGAHRSQVFRWKAGTTEPAGVRLLRLVALSKGKITCEPLREDG